MRSSEIYKLNAINSVVTFYKFYWSNGLQLAKLSSIFLLSSCVKSLQIRKGNYDNNYFFFK